MLEVITERKSGPLTNAHVGTTRRIVFANKQFGGVPAAVRTKAFVVRSSSDAAYFAALDSHLGPA